MSDTAHSPRTVDATGDSGGVRDLTADEFADLREHARSLVADASGIASARADFADSLFCRWAGQSADGRKHREALGEEVFPFEGASDMRIRLADFALRLFTMRQGLALERMSLRVVAGSDAAASSALESLLRNLIGDDLNAVWRREWRRLLQYAGGDTPGGAVMAVHWENRYRLRALTLDAGALLAATVTEATPEGDPAYVQSLLYSGDDAVPLAFLAVLAPGVKPKALRAALSALREGGSHTVHVPELLPGRPVIRARRLFRDIFFPSSTTDLQRARAIYEREWLTASELREREVTHGYSPEFIAEALKHEAVSFLPVCDDPLALGEVSSAAWGGVRETSARRGQYEVITAYYRAASESGATAVYMLPFHGGVKLPATARTPLDYAHGDYPFVWYGRETLGESLWDTRGIPELVATDQYALKLLNDSFNDHTTLASLPPRKLPAHRPDMRWTVAPLAELRVNRGDDVGFVTVPVPQTNLPMQDGVMKRVGAYFGIPGFADPEQIVTVAQSEADDFLPSVREVLLQMLALALQYLPAQVLAAKAGDESGALARLDTLSHDLRMKFDARVGSTEWVKSYGDIITRILAIDAKGEADRNFILRKLFAALGPDWTPAVRPAEDAAASEAADEATNFARIMAGDEPPMLPGGQNYALRLQTLDGILQKNPLIAARLAAQPDSAAILKARRDYLSGQITQQQNAVIGRNAAPYALGQQ